MQRTCFICLIVGAASPSLSQGQPVLRDAFGRSLGPAPVVLVDWDGYLANPAIALRLEPPSGSVFPATATLTANNGRLYFDEPSQVLPTGPTKTITFGDAAPRPFRLSIFPDRDGLDENYQLNVEFIDAAITHTSAAFGVHVVDQDSALPPTFAINLNYSQDAGGFFQDAARRTVAQKAVNDWAYFINLPGLDAAPAGGEWTWIWNYPAAWTSPPPNGHWVNSATAFLGFKLYTYGIQTPELRSGGEPSYCCNQSIGGSQLPLRRSGGVEIEMRGNFNTLGWFLTTGDDDWLASANFANEPNDLYSIFHHEFGHALAFNTNYPNFSDGEAYGFTAPDILDYYGGPITVNFSNDHFEGVVDPASQVGIFGNEYYGNVPRRRWLITKLDLLLLKSVGYPLRPTSCLVPLSIPPFVLPQGQVGAAYQAAVPASGGIPFYDWTVDSGALPPGLSLDRFTGILSGIPTADGDYSFVVRVRDDATRPGLTAAANIEIAVTCTPGDVDGNGVADGDDIDDYIRVQLSGTGTSTELCAAALDVDSFVSLLLGQ